MTTPDFPTTDGAREVHMKPDHIGLYTVLKQVRVFTKRQKLLLTVTPKMAALAIASHQQLVDALKAAELELREIISFTVLEKAALGPQELDSIKIVAAKARAALTKAGAS